MYTNLLLIALAGFTSCAATSEGPSWLTDYTLARTQGRADKKPVAIFVASGKEGWGKLVRSGSLGTEHQKILASNYICLHIDSATEQGKRMARLLEVPTGLGLVITDHSGQLMAFHHEGDLAKDALTGYLNRFADPQRVVRTTETNPPPAARTSYYYPPASAPATTYQPAFSGMSSGRSC